MSEAEFLTLTSNHHHARQKNVYVKKKAEMTSPRNKINYRVCEAVFSR